jgi:hypothetical protein
MTLFGIVLADVTNEINVDCMNWCNPTTSILKMMHRKVTHREIGEGHKWQGLELYSHTSQGIFGAISEKARNGSPLEHSQTATAWFWSSGVQNYNTNYCCVKLPTLWWFGNPRKQIYLLCYYRLRVLSNSHYG